MTSPWSPSYIAFLNFSSCSWSKISYASFSGRLGIFATISSYSINASLFSFPSYIIFCWALPLRILCKNRTATYLLTLSRSWLHSSFNSSFWIPVFHSYRFMFSSFFQFGVTGRATTFLSAWISLLTTSSSFLSGLSCLSIPPWATSNAFLWEISSLGSFTVTVFFFSIGSLIYERPA